MNDLRTAAQQALDSLRGYRREIGCKQPCDALTALKAALAQPEPKTNCRRAICQRAPDGYCAPCHERMYP